MDCNRAEGTASLVSAQLHQSKAGRTAALIRAIAAADPGTGRASRETSPATAPGAPLVDASRCETRDGILRQLLRRFARLAAVLHRQKYQRGALLLISGLTVSLATYLWSKAMNVVPLSIPVVLSPGHFRSPEFKARVSTQHLINVTFDSNIPPEELDCLIGTNIKSVQRCIGKPAILNVKWRILSPPQTIATGSSAELVGASYSYHRTERHIGSFDAESDKKYVLDVDVLQDASRLSLDHPRLEVEPNLRGYEGWLLLGGFAFYLGILGAAGGAIMICVTILRER